MNDEDRKLLLELGVAVAALTHLLADGEGIASLNDFRRKFDEKFAPLFTKLDKELG